MDVTPIDDDPPWASRSLHTHRWTLDDARRVFSSAPEPIRENPFANDDARLASVLIGLFEADGALRMVLTKRPRHLGTHAGEIAFPGGKFDPSLDDERVDTAIREAHEEIGIERDRVEILSELNAGATVVTNFIISPFVAIIESPTDAHWNIDPNEVEAVLCPRVADLYDPAIYRQERWDIPANDRWPVGAPNHPMHFFDLYGETIWGATARVLHDFLSVGAGLPPLGYIVE